jgi:hypothetical protein
MENAFVLSPRQETFLVRYSRRSKLLTAGLSLTGIVAFTYLVCNILLVDDAQKAAAGHHAPRIYGADSKDATEHNADSASTTRGATTASEVLNQQDDRNVPMAIAPDPDLSESAAQGELPRISEDGRQPWQVYARAYNPADKRPRLAILVTDLGLSSAITDAAVSRLPASVTLVFDAQSSTIGAWCARARQEGHEILLSLPMEPFDFPRSDPGAHTLLTTAPNNANLEKLNWLMQQGAGYIGITTLSGSRFTTDSAKLKVVMQTLRQRGLMVLDAHVAPHSAVTELAHEMHVPVATVNERIDDNLSPEAIDAAFQELEQVARLNGHAVGIVPALPIVIDHLQEWLKKLPQQGIALAPVSALVQ